MNEEDLKIAVMALAFVASGKIFYGSWPWELRKTWYRTKAHVAWVSKYSEYLERWRTAEQRQRAAEDYERDKWRKEEERQRDLWSLAQDSERDEWRKLEQTKREIEEIVSRDVAQARKKEELDHIERERQARLHEERRLERERQEREQLEKAQQPTNGSDSTVIVNLPAIITTDANGVAGVDLDRLARRWAANRHPGETDDELRVRISNYMNMVEKPA